MMKIVYFLILFLGIGNLWGSSDHAPLSRYEDFNVEEVEEPASLTLAIAAESQEDVLVAENDLEETSDQVIAVAMRDE